MGEDLQISQVHKNFSKVIIIQGRSNLGKYLRIKKIQETDNDELPRHVITADDLELIKEEYTGLQCQQCPKQISTSNKMYFDGNKYSEIPEVEAGECYCETHWKSQKVAQEL